MLVDVVVCGFGYFLLVVSGFGWFWMSLAGCMFYN